MSAGSWLPITAFLYLVATTGFAVHVLTTGTGARRVALASLAGGLLLNGFGVGAASLGTGGRALAAFHDQLALLAALVVGLYLVLQRRYRLVVVGAVISPLAFLLTAAAAMLRDPARELPPVLRTAWLPAHVAPAFLGYAVFAMACCVSLIYLLQERQLKAKVHGRLIRRLPSLETLDDLNYRFLAWGFVLFTVGIVSGSFLAKAQWGAFWSWEPVQVLSVLAWLLYAALLHARSVGWRGRRAATLTVVGFILLVASFVGYNLVFPGRHSGVLG